MVAYILSERVAMWMLRDEGTHDDTVRRAFHAQGVHREIVAGCDVWTNKMNDRTDEGYMTAIAPVDLLAALATGKSIEQVLGIESALIASEDDQSRLVSESELRALLPPALDRDEAIKRLIAVGLVDRHERKYRIRHERVFQLGVEATNAGIPLDALLDEFVRLRSDLHDIALRFVALFAGHVLRPFVEAGMPKKDLELLIERMKHLRQLAVEASDALMRQAIADEIETVARATLPNYPTAPPGRPAK
jgi:hypothetical protein